MRLTSHDRKRLKRLTRDLLFWRRKLVKGLEYVKVRVYSEDRAREMQKEVDTDVRLIGLIDNLLLVMAELNDMTYDLEEVHEVKVGVIQEVKVDEVE